MDLRDLADFNLVATHGGFGRASRASGRPKATLSRRIADLEDSLGVRLVERGARSLRLTEEGAALYTRTEGLLKEIAETGTTIGAGLDRPHGRLRVSAPVLFAHVALGRIAAAFAIAYPEVRLEITAEDRFVDPVEEGYDVVIRINPSPDDRLVGRCFLHDELIVVAPAAMARPTEPQGDVAVVRAVVRSVTPSGLTWRMQDGGGDLRPDPILRLSSLVMMLDAVRAGAGAAILPRAMVADDLDAGHLVSWGRVEDSAVAVWALHPSRRLVSGKVTAFLRCLGEAFPDRLLHFGSDGRHDAVTAP